MCLYCVGSSKGASSSAKGLSEACPGGYLLSCLGRKVHIAIHVAAHSLHLFRAYKNA